MRARRHQEEFASVKAAAQVAEAMAQVVTSPAQEAPKRRRKRDVVTGALKGVVMWVRMAGAVRKEAIDLVDDALIIAGTLESIAEPPGRRSQKA